MHLITKYLHKTLLQFFKRNIVIFAGTFNNLNFCLKRLASLHFLHFQMSTVAFKRFNQTNILGLWKHPNLSSLAFQWLIISYLVTISVLVDIKAKNDKVVKQVTSTPIIFLTLLIQLCCRNLLNHTHSHNHSYRKTSWNAVKIIWQ